MEAMNRIKAIWKASPRRVLGAACAVSVAGAVVVGSGANFTSVSANPGNSFTTGTLTHSNSKSGAAILTATGIKPGDPASTGTVDIANDGNSAANFTLKRLNVTNTDSGNPLASKLNVKVEDCGTPGGAPGSCTPESTVYDGTIAAMADQPLGSWAVSDAHRYRFSVTFPNGTAAADNPYQGDTATVEYQWEATQ